MFKTVPSSPLPYYWLLPASGAASANNQATAAQTGNNNFWATSFEQTIAANHKSGEYQPDGADNEAKTIQKTPASPEASGPGRGRQRPWVTQESSTAGSVAQVGTGNPNVATVTQQVWNEGPTPPVAQVGNHNSADVMQG